VLIEAEVLEEAACGDVRGPGVPGDPPLALVPELVEDLANTHLGISSWAIPSLWTGKRVR
jgi:hypothetical protein